jgi:leucyl/phenylalanyl-tRNA---protein transferase
VPTPDGSDKGKFPDLRAGYDTVGLPQCWRRSARHASLLSMSARPFVLTTDLVLRAYRLGLFPMAESRSARFVHWLDPERRGILPLDGFHLPKSLYKTARSGRFRVTANRDFAGTIAACAESRAERPETWINGEIERLFTELHRIGHAHSVEAWRDGRLVGGLYGVSLGTAFFGESMFSRETDASKVALVHLVAHLRLTGFALLDTQFITAHLARFGAIEVPRGAYHNRLGAALDHEAQFMPAPNDTAIAHEIAVLREETRRRHMEAITA